MRLKLCLELAALSYRLRLKLSFKKVKARLNSTKTRQTKQTKKIQNTTKQQHKQYISRTNGMRKIDTKFFLFVPEISSLSSSRVQLMPPPSFFLIMISSHRSDITCVPSCDDLQAQSCS